MSSGNLYVMVGIPGSGKSTASQQIIEKEPNTVILSSDTLREEYFGDESYQYSNKWLQENGFDIEEMSIGQRIKECNKFIFKELENRTIKCLKAGQNVIYDATNINDKGRIDLISKFSNYCQYIIAVVLATSYEQCIKNNQNRDRSVPEEVIERMSKNFVFPTYEEGFDDILVIGDDSQIDYK